jgi:hypothetical protein
MEIFPVVTLIIATFLLLIGIVGRGASVGSSQFHITLEGSIGRLPRVAILAVSIATYMLAIFGFVYIAESKSNSESPSQPTATAVEEESSSIKIDINSTLTDGAVEEHNEITIAGVPLVLYMDSDNPDASGTFELHKNLSGLDADYSIKVTTTDENGEEQELTGEGVIRIDDGTTYEVVYDVDGVPALE